MNGQGKIGTMRTAAVNLTDALLANATPGDVAVTMVPYDAWVLPPSGMVNLMNNVSGTNGACLDWSVWDTVLNSINSSVSRNNCSTQAWRTTRPYMSTATTASTYLNDLRASGTTSIDLGLRNGAMFFDPTMRPVISQLIANGEVDPVFQGRPFDWQEPNVVRALILLTDGQNCCGARYPTIQQDANTLATCTALKAQGVLIYSIAFQAPTRGAALMQACASSPSHYFNATTTELLSVFQGIGSNIQTQALRLTL
jgi:hypothetical protein